MYDEDEFNYNFDEKDMSVANRNDKIKSGTHSVIGSENKDAKELSLLHAEIEDVANKKKIKGQPDG